MDYICLRDNVKFLEVGNYRSCSDSGEINPEKWTREILETGQMGGRLVDLKSDLWVEVVVKIPLRDISRLEK